MIIDAHIHLYPPAVAADPQSWAIARREPYWLSCVLPENGPLLQGWSSADQLLRDMDAVGIDKSIIQGWYWEHHDTCAENADWQLKWIAAHPDRLAAFVPFNPNGGYKSIDLLKRSFDAGCIGIGELNPPAQGYRYDEPLFDSALELAASADALVSVHVTEPASQNYPGKVNTPFDELISMAGRHPSTRFIFAHLGGLLPFHELNRHARKSLANVWYDTAAVPLLYDVSVYRKVCDAIGHSRVLFGTDYPLRTFPRQQPQPSFQHHLNDLRAAQLSASERDAILGANLARLLPSRFTCS